jgi:hypothetical protein
MDWWNRHPACSVTQAFSLCAARTGKILCDRDAGGFAAPLNNTGREINQCT